jgi:hypothetical protein
MHLFYKQLWLKHPSASNPSITSNDEWFVNIQVKADLDVLFWKFVFAHTEQVNNTINK